MSEESMNKFILDVHERPELANLLKKSRKNFDSSEERFEHVAKEAKKYGYEFTVSDMMLAMGQHNNSLLDDDLFNVSGGVAVGEKFDFNNNESKKFWKLLL